jgi:D-alanyl-lipoteichoic acid acyltransferase DltB (MBOAT superfamily)
MLFNSIGFIFLFLPIAVGGFYLLRNSHWPQLAFYFLILMSLIFYSVWNPIYSLLLCGSLVCNYLIGLLIESAVSGRTRYSSTIPLVIGVTGNLGVLFYFKYTNFFIDNVNLLVGTHIRWAHVLLPLGISFFTFQKIAYLIDMSRGEIQGRGFWRYCLFVLFFPQLIAGPIVHFREISPQFDRGDVGRFPSANITIGLAIFAIGLFKKTVIADTASEFASPLYLAAHQGLDITFWEGWLAGLIYTVQLYFDFSGYSDMAIGLARMFGVRLPLNFHSPLKSLSIIDYWRRWHMTLQRFIVSYIFQPIAIPMNRLAAAKDLGRVGRFAVALAMPSLISFLLIGIWHGAGWTFVIFGLMHGAYIVANEIWREINRKRRRRLKTEPTIYLRSTYWLLTLVCVLCANVMFRAESVTDALAIYRGMLCINGLGTGALGLNAISMGAALTVFIGFSIILLCPNTQQIMRRYGPALDAQRWIPVSLPTLSPLWRPTFAWAGLTAFVLYFGIIFVMRGQSEFIYFNF